MQYMFFKSNNQSSWNLTTTSQMGIGETKDEFLVWVQIKLLSKVMVNKWFTDIRFCIFLGLKNDYRTFQPLIQICTLNKKTHSNQFVSINIKITSPTCNIRMSDVVEVIHLFNTMYENIFRIVKKTCFWSANEFNGK